MIIITSGIGLAYADGSFPGKNTFGDTTNNIVTNDYSTAFGSSTTASGTSSAAFGQNTEASQKNSAAFGSGTTASGEESVAFGAGTQATGSQSAVFGYNNVASEDSSIAFGWNNHASGIGSAVFGVGNIATNDGSVAFGSSTISSGQGSTAFGKYTTASGYRSTAFGWSTTASGDDSIAFGWATTASGDNSVALGENTAAQAYNSLVLGRYNEVSGSATTWIDTDPVFVIGNGDINTNNNAVTVLKNGNVGIGESNPKYPLEVVGSATFGNGNSDASGLYSVAFGTSTRATEHNSAAFGTTTKATGGNSVALGQYTEAQALSSLVMGRYNEVAGDPANWINTDPLFVIGNGDVDTKNNAVTVLKNGNVGIGISDPIIPLQVAGIIESTTDGFKFPDGSIQTTAITSTDSYWAKTGNGISYTSGNIGIGTLTPNTPLQVIGSATFGSSSNIANGTDSVAFGDSTTVIGSWSSAFGFNNIVSAERSAAFGSLNIVKEGTDVVAFGSSNIASGNNAAAFGWGNTASGLASSVFGRSNTATGYWSSAFGFLTNSTGDGSAAFGYQTESQGSYSSAFGENTIASGKASTSFGQQTTTRPYASFVVGTCNKDISGDPNNWVATDPLFVIGNGEVIGGNWPSCNTNVNAVTVLKNGNVGIGTSSPQVLLHVNGTTAQMPLAILQASEGNGLHIAGWKKGANIDPMVDGDNIYIGRDIELGNLFIQSGDVGIGKTSANSALDVKGYVELDVSDGSPPKSDCNTANEVGRMKVDESSPILYVCTSFGWKSTLLS